MRKRKLTFGLFSLMMAASVALTGNVNVSAATKKLSVNSQSSKSKSRKEIYSEVL